MKALKGQTTNIRVVTCKCPIDTNRKIEHGVSIDRGQGHMVQTGNSYMFYCTECYNKHTNTVNNTMQTVGQSLTEKATIQSGYIHQVAMTVSRKDTDTVNRLKRNGYNTVYQGKTVVRVVSPFITNLNGIAKQFNAMGLTDRKIKIITVNANGEQFISKGKLSTVVLDCQKARTHRV